jgi:hypothetical protein
MRVSDPKIINCTAGWDISSSQSNRRLNVQEKVAMALELRIRDQSETSTPDIQDIAQLLLLLSGRMSQLMVAGLLAVLRLVLGIPVMLKETR